jgi:hypothetical protein
MKLIHELLLAVGAKRSQIYNILQWPAQWTQTQLVVQHVKRGASHKLLQE